jgi:putative ABC transport system permease protein
VTLLAVAVRNAVRNRFRTLMTIVGGAVAVLAFVALQTILNSWNVGSDYAAKDRLATRHKVSFVFPLPKRYIEDVARIPGVKTATYANWFGGEWPKDPNQLLVTLGVADNIFDVYPEISVPAGALEKWGGDKKGAIVGDVLAKRLGLQVGDQVTLTGTLYPGDWEFTVDGIYTAPSQVAVDRSTFYLHWDYLNEGAPPRQKDLLGWILTRVDDPANSAAVSSAIDKTFDDRDVQTATMSEKAMNNSFLSGIGGILSALNFCSVMILVIMMLVLGNTIAMGVRERTAEYGVLRALGFAPRDIRFCIVGEALTVSLLAALFGCALAYPLVQLGGKWFEENMGQFFPYFRVNPSTMAIAIVSTLLLGGVASFLPAVRAGRLQVTAALRRIG